MSQQLFTALTGVYLRLWQRRVLLFALVLAIVFLITMATPGSETFACFCGQATGGTYCPGC